MLGDSCWCRFNGIEKGKENHIAQESYKTRKKCQGIRLISSNFFSLKCHQTAWKKKFQGFFLPIDQSILYFGFFRILTE